MSIHSMMNTTVTIKTETQTVGSLGGANIAYTTKASNVKARIRDLVDGAAVADGRLASDIMQRVYFDTDQSLTIKDVIVIDGINYAIRKIDNAGGRLNRLWQIDVEKLPSVGG